MKHLIIFVFIFASLVLNSCSTNPNGKNEESLQVTGYDADIPMDSLRNRLEGISIVQLESQDDYMLEAIDKIVMDDSVIYVSDKKALYSFDLSGKFIRKFGERGKAENEYINLSTFMIDPEGNILIVDSYTGKTITFSPDGKYMRCDKYRPEQLKYVQNGRFIDDGYMLLSHYIYNDYNTVYSIVNPKNHECLKEIKCALRTLNVMEPIGRSPFTDNNSDNGYLYVLPFSAVIYSSDPSDNLDIITTRKVESQNALAEIDNFSIMTYFNVMQAGGFMGFTDIFDSPDNILLLCKNLGLTIINKNDLTCAHARMESYDYPFSNLYTSSGDTYLSAVDPSHIDPTSWKRFAEQYHITQPSSSYELIENNGNPIIITFHL